MQICKWHFNHFWFQPHQHTTDTQWFQWPSPQPTLHSRTGTRPLSELSIHWTPTDINTAVYRKPTFTDTIIPHTSNHPAHHKYATVKFLYNRLNTYDLKQTEYNQELNTKHNILHNNAFPIRDQKPHKLLENPTKHTTQKKWATFTYVGRETSYITNLFKKTELNVAFWTKNTIGNLLAHRQPAPDKCSLSGVYKLTCPDCNKAYIGQTGRKFTTRFLQHKKSLQKP